MEVKALKFGGLTAKRPIVQGGMGVGVSLSSLAGNVAKCGGIGTISGVHPGYREADFKENPFRANLRAIGNELEKAKDADNKMIVFSVFCCVIVAVCMLFIGRFFPQIYNTSEEIRALATKFIAVSAIIMPFCSFSHASYFTLRSGGKTMVTFLFDSVFTWIVVVPTAFLLAHFTGLGIVSVYFLVQATELIKVVIGYFMVHSNVWLVQMV